jgi:hypothetical protein
MAEPSYLTPEERAEWERVLEAANRTNIFCHCRSCGHEWVASEPQVCECGSRSVQAIACWQFPDD